MRRAPTKPLILLPHTLTEETGPVFGHDAVREGDNDLTRQHAGEPQGERIIVSGRVVDEDGRPVPRTLIEIWQTNAAGRYAHQRDQHPAPLDPNFTGAGRTLTDDDGSYRFVTIKPGAYPWRNHANAWRPAHIHFSLFGPAFATRLITQMYFPGRSAAGARSGAAFRSRMSGREQRLVSRLDHGDDGAGVGAGISMGHRAAGQRRDAV